MQIRAAFYSSFSAGTGLAACCGLVGRVCASREVQHAAAASRLRFGCVGVEERRDARAYDRHMFVCVCVCVCVCVYAYI
jgi:hypothetical protein